MKKCGENFQSIILFRTPNGQKTDTYYTDGLRKKGEEKGHEKK